MCIQPVCGSCRFEHSVDFRCSKLRSLQSLAPLDALSMDLLRLFRGQQLPIPNMLWGSGVSEGLTSPRDWSFCQVFVGADSPLGVTINIDLYLVER